MPLNALLFPGQGSQEVGMGKELYETLPEAKEKLDIACDILDYDLKDIIFNGPLEKLTDTKYAQPAIYTCSAMHLEKVRSLGIEYDYVAGHSLGEYSALYAAGVFDFEDGLRLVSKRGSAMATQNGKGSMAAVLGLSEDELKAHLPEGVFMANLNSKTQIVVSGTEEGIEKLSDTLKPDEIRVIRLKVSAAFHSPQMREAEDIMRPEIESVTMMPPQSYVVSNITGVPTKDLSTIRSNLIKQITGQVRWYDSILNLKQLGVDLFYECGNGEVLTKMNKTITLRPKCISI